MAKLIQPPPKLSPAQWQDLNRRNYSSADEERAAAQKLRAECERLRKETDATTVRTQESVGHKFSQRIRDIAFWKEELEKKVEENSAETRLLVQRKEELERALAATTVPLKVAGSCLEFRKKRVSVDLVHDDVDIQLAGEVTVIEGVQSLLQQTFDHAVEQIRLLKSCKYKLEKELADKLQALSIDDQCATLSENSAGIGLSQEGVKIQTNSVTPEQWVSFSDENILRSERERKASSTLRGAIHGALEQSRQDIEKQRSIVNLAFAKRIQETSETKSKLEQHLKKVCTEINAMEDNISSLQQAIGTKTGPMQLAQTRLDIRSYRPNNELVRDPVQYSLVGEVGEIAASVEQLQARLVDSESALKGLNRNQLALEEDISVKTLSLAIDQDECMAMREKLEPLSSPDSN